MSGKRRYHFHWPGALYIVVTVLIGVGAINSQNNLLFLLFGVSVGAFGASGLLSGVMLMRVRVSRSLPRSATAGQVFRIRYEVMNRSRLTALMGLTIDEIPCRKRRVPGGKRCWTRSTTAPLAFVTHLSRGSRAEMAAPVRALRRGVAVFEGVRVSTRFPFGVVRKSITFGQRSAVVIRPASLRVPRSFLGGIGSDDAYSEQPARSGAMQGEFHGLREYMSGDPMRLIAWKASARSDELVVREHAMSSAQRVWIELRLRDAPTDLGGDADDAENEKAISIAASIAEQLVLDGLAVGLIAPGHAAALHPATGPPHLGAILDALALIDSGERPDPGASHVLALAGESLDQQIVVVAGDRAPAQVGKCVVVCSGQIPGEVRAGVEVRPRREGVPA